MPPAESVSGVLQMFKFFFQYRHFLKTFSGGVDEEFIACGTAIMNAKLVLNSTVNTSMFFQMCGVGVKIAIFHSDLQQGAQWDVVLSHNGGALATPC